MYLTDVINKMKKEKRKREIRKVGKKLVSGIMFGARVGIGAAILIYANSDNRGHKEIKQVKKTISEIHEITDEVKEYIKQNAREVSKDIPREVKKFQKKLRKNVE